jgi:peptidyl-prolyl cis-trans isomerase D
MLQTIRDKLSGWIAKIVLGALAVVFVFWGIELRSVTGSGSDAASVNGDNISLSAAQKAWQERQSQLAQAFKGDIPDSFKKQQQQTLLDQLIRTRMLEQHIDELGYRVSDTQVAETLYGIDALKVDGKFSRDRYVAALSQQGMSDTQFEAQLRIELASKQLQNGIVGTAFLTPAEATRAQALLNEQREVDYATISAKSFAATVTVADADVQSYYDANKTSYLTPENVDLQYVELKLADVAKDVTVDDASLRAHYDQIKDRFTTTERRRAHHILIPVGNGVDDAAAKKQAEEVLAKLKAGGDFEALAKQYSKDPGSAAKGGDLGWATRGMFVGPFEDALFTMSASELRGPVKSDFGYHVIRLDEIEAGQTKPFELVRAEVEVDYKNDRARSLFYDKTQKLADSAFTKLTELDTVAKEFGTTLKTITDFTRDGGGEFDKDSPVVQTAFSEAVLEKGENSPLVTIGEERALVLRIADHKLPEQKPLEQVRADILANLRDRAAKTAAAQKGNELVNQLQSGAVQWAAVAKAAAVTPVGKKWLGRKAQDVSAIVLNSAFAVPKNSVDANKPAYRGVALENGDYAVVAVSAVQSGTAAADAAKSLVSVRDQRTTQTANAEFDGYVREMERTAKIVRNPAAFD